MSEWRDPMRFCETWRQTRENVDYRLRLEELFSNSTGSIVERLDNFAKYVPRQQITSFLSKYEIFKRILHIQGSIIECGVLFGGGLMTWAQLSSIFEPLNYQRQVIGFDTFAGFPDISTEDESGKSELRQPGGFSVDSFEDLIRCAQLYDANRFLNHIPRIQLVKGDARSTIPEFVKSNPHLVVSLLHLDFDIYAPTKVALEHFVPRMPKGAIIAFDELNCPEFPGEALAVLETVGVRNLRIERFPFDTYISFAVLE